tara:strand:- start:1494 stop:2435 length:942 start_codon:yes stop_codon:yes gene_type:complete
MFTNSTHYKFNEGIATNNNVDIYYRDYGPEDAEPVLLIQGLGGQLVNWPQHLLDCLLDNNFRPIVFDNRDAGLSSKIKSDIFDDNNRKKTIVKTYFKYYTGIKLNPLYTIDDMSKDAISVLDSLNVNEAHIVGISMGGMISQLLASNYSERVKSLTLIASTASTPSPLNGPERKVRKLLMRRSNNPNASIDERMKRTKKIFSIIGYQGFDLDSDEFNGGLKESIKRGGNDDSGFSRQILAILGSKDRIKKVKTIKAKTLIIHGKDDPLIPVKNAYKAERLIKNSKLVIVDQMRHLIEPPVFDQFKKDFIEHLS